MTSRFRTLESAVFSSRRKSSRSKPAMKRSILSMRSIMSSIRSGVGLRDIEQFTLDDRPVAWRNGSSRDHLRAYAEQCLDPLGQIHESHPNRWRNLNEDIYVAAFALFTAGVGSEDGDPRHAVLPRELRLRAPEDADNLLGALHLASS